MEEDHSPQRTNHTTIHQPIHHRPYPPEKPMNKPMGPGMGMGMGPRFNQPEEYSRRALCTCIFTVILLLALLILVLWLVYRPTKPHVMVVGAAVYGLNATAPPLMSTNMQFTILIRNPNRRVAIYFDALSVFVTYRDQPITPQVVLPPLYLEEHSSVSLSPVVGGSPVPVSAEVSSGFATDQAFGAVGVKLIMQGKLRWKTGAVRTAHYGMYVRCDLMLGLKKGNSGQVPLLGAPTCNVNI